jgi:hypothetical protein
MLCNPACAKIGAGAAKPPTLTVAATKLQECANGCLKGPIRSLQRDNLTELVVPSARCVHSLETGVLGRVTRDAHSFVSPFQGWH